VVDPRRTSYDEATCGSSWYVAGKAAGMEGTHQVIADKARRLARGHASMYGREWPLEDIDLLAGKDAFQAGADTDDWAAIALQLDYASAEEARAEAVGWASEEAVVELEATHVGRVAYRMRSVELLEWKDIGAQLGRPYLQTKADARAYAETSESPWPIRRGKDPENGRKSYDLKKSGLEWKDIGIQLGCGESNAYMRARKHAEANSLLWPIGRRTLGPEDEGELRNLGGRAYRMRSEEGFTWQEIGPAMKLTQKNAILAARLFAEVAGERWPIIPNFRPELGEQAYRMFSVERMKWTQIAVELDAKRGTVIDRAKIWSRTSSHPWPPSKVMVTTGKLAYEMRAETHMKWVDIGTHLHRTRDFATASAKKYAKQNGLPWPVPLPATADPHLRRLETGRKVYALRLEGKDWPTVLEALGISLAWGHRTGGEHAKINGLEWPLSMSGQRDTDQEAYELRLTGISWTEISEKQECSKNTVHDRARRHAKRSGKPWPINVAPVRRHFSKRAKRAFELGYGERMKWAEVAKILDYASGQSALNCAQVYAVRFGLAYPRQKPRAYSARKPERLQRSYELRRDTDMTWAEIGKEVGYVNTRSSFTAALKWAGQNTLPWPPRLGVPVGSSEPDPA
jgi:hypothetical protein